MSNPRIPYRMSHSGLSLPPLAGKRLIVHLVVNVEHWQFEQPMPRTLLTPPHGREQVPDIPNFAWAEYGMRCGMPRILALLASRGVTASTSFNAGVIDAYPQCAEAILQAGWEFVGHGIHQRAIHGENDEKSHIEEALEKIRFFAGSRPRGWLSPGLRETVETPDLLRAAGIDYVFDWVLDDLPCWMATKHGPLIAMPYTLEINDSVIYAVERHASGEMERRFERTLALFEREMKTGPRILTLALHPHLIGVPHRLGELERMLDRLLHRDDAIFVTGAVMADWFVAAQPPADMTGS